MGNLNLFPTRDQRRVAPLYWCMRLIRDAAASTRWPSSTGGRDWLLLPLHRSTRHRHHYHHHYYHRYFQHKQLLQLNASPAPALKVLPPSYVVQFRKPHPKPTNGGCWCLIHGFHGFQNRNWLVRIVSIFIFLFVQCQCSKTKVHLRSEQARCR